MILFVLISTHTITHLTPYFQFIVIVATTFG